MTHNCQSCEAIYINGVFCHETGCPDAWRTWRECCECGQPFMPEHRFEKACSDSCLCAYNGYPCEDNEVYEQALDVADVL
jgi:hypothetical protein